MKVFNFLCTVLALMFILSLTGCIGDEGPMGIQGEQGIAGLDGNIFYSGNTAPAANVGKDGDMYLDKVSATLYGPKLSGSWGTGIPLKGAEGPQGEPGATGQQGAPGVQGPAGTPGSKILSGNGSPASSLGVTADYYLDKVTGLLYGPKSVSGWGTPINLKGEQGIQGLPGKDGSMFYSGNGAPLLSVGKEGDMYLDKTNVMLYGPKTTETWGAGMSLKGNTGEAGQAGAPGTPGSKILSGTGAPALSMGTVGDFYLDTSTALFYGPKTSTSWGTPVNLKGPKGDKGDKGDPGAASVIYSDWMVVEGYPSFYYIKVPEFINDPKLIDNASIVLYAKEFKLDGRTELGIFQLNFTSPTWGSVIQYYIMANDFDIVINANPDTKLGLQKSHLFRYVIIPGGVQATRSMVDLNNYNAVKEAFGLKD